MGLAAAKPVPVTVITEPGEPTVGPSLMVGMVTDPLNASRCGDPAALSSKRSTAMRWSGVVANAARPVGLYFTVTTQDCPDWTVVHPLVAKEKSPVCCPAVIETPVTTRGDCPLLT